jgi:hypothetical protein
MDKCVCKTCAPACWRFENAIKTKMPEKMVFCTILLHSSYIPSAQRCLGEQTGIAPAAHLLDQMHHHHRPWPTAHIAPEASETPEMWEKGSFPGQRDKLGPQQRNKLHTQPKKDQIYAHTCQEGRDIYSLCLHAIAEYCCAVCKMFKSSHAVKQANGMQRSSSYMHAPLIHTYKGHQAYMIHQRFCQIL